MENLLTSTYRALDALEHSFDLDAPDLLDKTMQLINLLQQSLSSVKDYVCTYGFDGPEQEIKFFKYTKPQLLGKLMYYNKVFRIESGSPVSALNSKKIYFSQHMRFLKKQHQENLKGEEFYRYHRSKRSDLDQIYFQRGNVDIKWGMDSFVFEIDPAFSTYYDYKVARIIANDMLFTFLALRVSFLKAKAVVNINFPKPAKWTDSASAMIELIYALHAAETFANGKISIRQISRYFQQIFDIPLHEVHHAFHRMKTRAGSRTVFLDRLKVSLERYMDQNL